MNWISTKDRLPEQAKRVLVWVDYYNMKCATIACRKRNMWHFESIMGGGRVTHWMPMPPMPDVYTPD